MASMDSKADFGAMMNELDIPEKARKWLQDQGFLTIWHLLLFSQQMEMNYNKFPMRPGPSWGSIQQPQMS